MCGYKKVFCPLLKKQSIVHFMLFLLLMIGVIVSLIKTTVEWYYKQFQPAIFSYAEEATKEDLLIELHNVVSKLSLNNYGATDLLQVMKNNESEIVAIHSNTREMKEVISKIKSFKKYELDDTLSIPIINKKHGPKLLIKRSPIIYEQAFVVMKAKNYIDTSVVVKITITMKGKYEVSLPFSKRKNDYTLDKTVFLFVINNSKLYNSNIMIEQYEL